MAHNPIAQKPDAVPSPDINQDLSRDLGHDIDQAIGTELEHIIASDTFRAAPRLAAFLRFVVEMALAGRSDRIKGYTIGAEALGRGAGFDPQADPIVRVEAARLRRALARYYNGSGRNDPIMIALPRGGYVPTFHTRAADAASAARHSGHDLAMPSMPNGAALAAVLDGMIAVRQQQAEAITAEVEAARRLLGLLRGLLGVIGGEACCIAPPQPDAISTGEPAHGPHQSETPPHSPCRHCPDRQP